MRLKLKVKTVFLLTKAHDETLIGYTREVVDWLLSKDRETPYIVYVCLDSTRVMTALMRSRYVETTLEHNHKFDAKGILGQDPSREGRLKYWTNELCQKHPHTFDFVVTVLFLGVHLQAWLTELQLGGDGTLLYASWLFQRIVPPVLSFALGSLGFLTKFDYAGFRETLTKAFGDGVTVSLRLRFEGTVMRSQTKGSKRDLVEELIGEEAENDYTHKPECSYEILNDIVVDRGPNPSMLVALISKCLGLHGISNVSNRDFRRRRAFHHSSSRWRLRGYADRLDCIQSRRWRILVSSRESSDTGDCYLRPYSFF